uniref:Uncharacterized protein n=1 Tax=Catagonus wagneri TaxID=51154 RepID=A0A8C3WVN8_9CETA
CLHSVMCYMLESLRSRCWPIQFLEIAYFLVHRLPSSCSHSGRGAKSLCGIFFKFTYVIREGSKLMTKGPAS